MYTFWKVWNNILFYINFGIDFIESARDVYKLNDKRAEIKRELNKLYQSDIIEEKSYK